MSKYVNASGMVGERDEKGDAREEEDGDTREEEADSYPTPSDQGLSRSMLNHI